jgi:hypothetical protein
MRGIVVSRESEAKIADVASMVINNSVGMHLSMRSGV